MFRRFPRGLALVVSAALALTGPAAADGVLPHPAPAVPCPEVTVPCPAPCPAPKIELVMPPPNVRVVTAAGHGCTTGGVCKAGAKAPAAKDCDKDCGKDGGSKGCSFLNFSITKIKGGAGRAAATETTVVPAFATATIPIALQTTRTLTGVSESAFIGRRTVSREEVAAAVREALAEEREAAAQKESAATAQDACAALKERVAKVEQRLTEIEKTVKLIEEKITKK
jgi:hypothetical protein